MIYWTAFIIAGIYLSNKKSMIEVDFIIKTFQIDEKYKDKFDFKVFNEPFVDEKEAAIKLEDLNIYHERKNALQGQ